MFTPLFPQMISYQTKTQHIDTFCSGYVINVTDISLRFTLIQNTGSSTWSLTVKLLDSQPVVQVQLEVVNVFHRTLVVWPHDGRISGGMGQAQRVAKFMHCNCEQVCAAAVT